MKCDAAYKYLFWNGELRSASESTIFNRIDGNSVYEVIKLIQGVPLFFEDHMERLKRSALLLGAEIAKPASVVRREIEQLVKNNNCTDINVKLVWYPSEREPAFLTYFVPQDFPEKEAYRKGVHTILYSGERENPQIKAVRTSYRERVRTIREAAGAYEALLVDENGYISEGTRSNIFYVFEDRLCTPPSDAVLLGVTRRHVLALCRQLDVGVWERRLHRDELDQLKGAFLTGTTIDVLPVGSIDHHRLASVDHPTIRVIALNFKHRVDAYIAELKAATGGLIAEK